jgi:beta-galactosidase
MFQRIAAAVCLCVVLLSGVAMAAEADRVSINRDWRFTKDDPADIGTKMQWPAYKPWMDSTGEEFVLSPDLPKHPRPGGNLFGDLSYIQADFNDSQWRQLSLPHDWGIEGPFVTDRPDPATGRLPFWGVGWYRKKLDIPSSSQGKQVYLDIDGAMSYSSVWLNGQYVGGWGYGYSSYRLDLTPYVKFGQPNQLAIRLENPANSSRWYPGGGIYRNVWLVTTPAVHVGHWGTYITTPEVSPQSATINLRTTVENDSPAAATVTVKTALYAIDANDQRQGNPVATIEAANNAVAAGKSQAVESRLTIPNPRLWSVKTPNRYLAVTTIEQNGAAIDTYETPFGIRTTTFDPDKGFALNGEFFDLQGVCDHHDLGALGSAINRRALQRQLEILKEMGCNAIRTSHNMPAPELLDLCDKMGFMVIDETFDCWVRGKRTNDYSRIFQDWHEKDLRSLIRRDRNHPSVIIWSVGNEVGEVGNPPGQHQIAEMLVRISHEEDPTRPATVAVHNLQAGYRGLQEVLDIFGYNYLRGNGLDDQLRMYIKFHEANPKKFVFSTESASTISTRGFYLFPFADAKGGGYSAADQQMSSYDLYAPAWATPPDWEFKAQDMSPFSGGEFVWTGFDYLGEPTVNGGFGGRRGGRGGGDATAAPSTLPANTRRSSYFGIIDLAGFKKDRFYLYQSRWRPDFPMAHILPHWNWPDRVGQVTPVHVYTSGNEAELFLNGKSLGKKKKGEYEYRLRWDDVVYEPGELKVVAYKDGKQWAEETVKTTGPASKVMLTPDRAQIIADGTDLSFVTVSVADAAGAMVPASMNLLRFEISGPGEIAGVDNGDPTSLVSFQSPQMQAFNGLCLVIVRSKPGQAGPITLRVTSDGLEAATATITSAAK